MEDHAAMAKATSPDREIARAVAKVGPSEDAASPRGPRGLTIASTWQSGAGTGGAASGRETQGGICSHL